MKRAATHFEQVPTVIAEKVLARETAPPAAGAAGNSETAKTKVNAAARALRSRKV